MGEQRDSHEASESSPRSSIDPDAEYVAKYAENLRSIANFFGTRLRFHHLSQLWVRQLNHTYGLGQERNSRVQSIAGKRQPIPFYRARNISVSVCRRRKQAKSVRVRGKNSKTQRCGHERKKVRLPREFTDSTKASKSIEKVLHAPYKK